MAQNFTTFTPLNAVPAFTTFTPLESIGPSVEDEEQKKREQAPLVTQKQEEFAPSLEAMSDPYAQLATASVPPAVQQVRPAPPAAQQVQPAAPEKGVIQRIGDFLRPEFKSVLDTPATVDQQQQNRDRRLSYGAGPINQQTESAANLLRSGETGTQDQTVRRVAKAMQEQGRPTFADVAARAKKPEVVRAVRDAKADEFRSAGEWAADTLSSISQGTVGLVELPLNIFAPSSGLAKSLRATQKELQEQESDVLKAQRAQLLERVQNEDGFFGKYFATVESLITNPAMGLSEAVKQVPNFLSVVGAAKLGTALTGAAINTASRVSPTIALAEAISGNALLTGARAAGATAGGISAATLMTSGDAAGNVYQTLTDPKKTPMSVWRTNPDFQSLVAQGKTPKQAIEEISTAKARLAAAIVAPLGVLGFMGAEAAFVAQGGTRAAMQAATPKGAAKLFGKEIGLEQIQEGGTQAGANVASQTVNPEQSLLEGVPEAMATAAVTSGPFAGAAVARQMLQDQQAQVDPFVDAEARRRFDVQAYDPSIVDPASTRRPRETDPGKRLDQLLDERDRRIEPTLDDAALVSQPPRLESDTAEQGDVPGMATEGDISDIDAPAPSLEFTPNMGLPTAEDLAADQAANPQLYGPSLNQPITSQGSVTPVTLPPPTKAAESLPETPTVPPVSTPKLFEPPVAGHAVADFPVVQVPVADLKLSQDVPQFKAGATDKGVVDPLTGKFTQEGVAPIAVWRRLDGSLEVISGRHRLDLAQRSKTKFINAQVYDEAQGFTAADASTLDAELNIRDEQGKVKDYVNYFKASGTDRETAESKGLLGRVKGKRGFAIANQGSDALIAAINGDQIGDEAAYYIAINAPNDERLQGVGLQSIMDGKSMNAAVNTMEAVKAMAAERDTTTDMFGFDDSLIKEAQEMAKIASKMQQSVASRLSAITGAAKNPAMAKAEGIDVRDPEAVKRRIAELKEVKAALENWSTNPEIVAEIRAQRGGAAPQFELRSETPQETVDRESTQDAERRAAEEKNQADNEVDFFQLQPQTQEKTEAPTEDMFAGEAGPSAEYLAAIETSNRAIAAFKKVQEAYRKQEIGDDDYLAARKVYDKAVEAFDKAIKKEQGRGQVEEQDQAAIDEQEAAAYEALQKQAEDEIDAGPIGQALQRIENGDFETKAQVRNFVNRLEKNGILDDVEEAREGLSDREQSADDVLDTVRSLLDDARDNAIQERLDELESEQSQAAEIAQNEAEFIEESTKDKLEAIAQDFMVGDMVRFGSIPGTVVGIEGDYVRMRPDSATSPKAYQRVPKSSLTIVARPDNTSTMSFSREQDNKFGNEAGQLNANMGNLIQLLGANMYSSSLAEVTIKELLQNSFDAVKGAVANTNAKGEKIKSLYKTGKIEITIDQTNRTITIKDNARGMTPQIVRDAFFTVAGSDKSDLPPGQRSGGLGLAKMGFMLGAENLKLDTVRDGVRVTVDTTSANIANNNFTIQKSPAPKDEHGTTVTVKIPEFYIDPKNGDERPIYFPYSQRSINALNQPLIGPVEVTFKDEYSEPVVLPVGVNFESKKYSKFKANFDWGSADIFFGIERKPDRYSINHKVLSAGVYQFSPDFSLDNEKIPYDIVVNISPNVDARHPDYPFVNSRENFKDRIKKDVEALQAYLGQIARGLEAKDLQESFKGVVSMPRIEAGQDIADISDKLKKTFDKQKAEKPAPIKELPKEVTVTADTVTDTKTQKVLVDVKAKEKEKQKDASFKGSTVPTSADFMLDLKQDPKLPAFHNNTNVDYLEIGRQYGEPEKFFAELGTLMVEMKEDLAKSGMYGYSTLAPENLFFAGISIDKKYGGVHIKVPYKAVFINPFYSFGARTLFGTRQQQLNVMIHELAHTGSMDHGVAHNAQMIKVEQYLADEGLLDYYRDAILDILRRHESTFTAMKEAYDRSSTQNVAKSLEDYEKGSAAASSRGDTGGAGDAPSAVSARAGQGRGEGVSGTQEDDAQQDRGAAKKVSGRPGDLLMNIESNVEPSLAEQDPDDFIFGSAKIREEQIKEYAALRAKLARIPKQVAGGEADLSMQRAVARLMQQARDLNASIKATKPRRDSAEQFLAKAALEYDKGNISEEVFNVIKLAYDKMPDVLEGLLLSVKAGKGGVAGSFSSMMRIVSLYKESSGVSDPTTIRHELTHSLEQMMTPEQKLVVAQAWVKSLQAAIKKNPDEAHQKYFHAVMDFFDNPSEETYRKAVALLPSYDMYQFINPSEYWAVNAEGLMAAELGSSWDKFKRAVARLWEGMKSIIGFDNRYAVQKMFKDVMNGSRQRISTDVIADLMSGTKISRPKINMLENIDDDKKLVKKYNRPATPQLDPSPTKTVLVNGAKASKEYLKLAFEDPLDALGTAANAVDRGVMYARNKNVWFGSGLNAADFAKYNGQLKTSQGLATASVALDNAIRGGQIATEVIFQGGIKFDSKSLNFVATKKAKGMRGVYEAEAALKKRLGDQLGTDIIQGYLEAKRSRSIQNEFFERQAKLEVLKAEYEQLLQSGASEKDIKIARDDLADARKEFKDIEIVFNKINMSDSEIDEFIAREQVHPELRKIMDNWSAVNKNMLNFWRQVGLLSQKRYDALSNIQDYVPWQRIMNDETDIHSPVQATNRTMTNIGLERVFKKGTPTVITDFKAEKDQQVFKIQPAKVLTVEVNGKTIDPVDIQATPEGEVRLNVPIAKGDLVVFTASREIENIIDNMTRNVMRMTMNGMRQYAAQRIVSEYATRDANGRVMTFPKIDLDKGRFNFIVNGRKVVVEIQDPLIAESIIGMETLGIAMWPILAAAANITRRSITLSGVFQLKQVFKDAPTAALVTGVKNPLALIGGVYKGLVTSLAGLDPTINILKSAGIGGFQSAARTPEAEVKRRIGVMNRNVFDFMIKGLDHIGDSSDMAQRVATYKRVLAETGDEAQALYQAANVINFLHHGSGQVAQFVVKTVPFAGAYANATDVLFQAMAGGGLRGKTRAQNLAAFAKTATLLSMVTLMYLLMVGDDEEYNQLDDQTKLRNFMIPGTKIMLPMNTNAAFIFKVIPELIYNKVIKEGTDNAMDARRLRTALKEAAIDLFLGPTPVPSAAKPIIEIGLNRDFFTGRAVVPEAMAKLDAAERYTAETSELGKRLSSLTGTDEKRILDPIEADHIIRGIFGTTGAMVQWVSNSLGAAAGERVAPTDKQAPITGPFLRADVPRRNEALFYDFKKLVDNKYGTYSKMIERGDDDAADAYIDKHGDVAEFYKEVNKIDSKLKEINAEIRYMGEGKDTGMTPKERRAAIIELQREKQEVTEDIIEMRKDAGL